MRHFKRCIFSFLLFAICYFLPSQVLGQVWVEYWQNYAFRKTNFSDAAPKKVEDFSMLITVLRGGYRIPLTSGEKMTSWRIGLDGYGRFEHVHDFRYKHKLSNFIVYNNHYRYGGGFKLHLQREWIIRHWLRYLQVDVFTEWQKMDASIDTVRMQMKNIERSNQRTGINIWANSGKVYRLRHEVYFDFSRHSTNFADPGDSPFLILTLSPRIFYNLGFIDVYLNPEIVHDFLNKGDWNRNPFSNNFKATAGARIVLPFQKLFGVDKKSWLAPLSILFFAEHSRISFFDDISEWPFGNDNLKLADFDTRIGFIIWAPFGAAKYRPIGQSSL